MKPIYIEMNAFGSYQKERIDFDEVNRGLFLITGDTGAGKTTIFDAITYALYDRTSGGKRDGEMMRSQYAAPDIKTQVKFKFLYRDEEYTITRSPRQDKWKRIEDESGLRYEKLKTQMQPEVELIMPDGSVYSGKKKDVDEKIEEIIGLTVTQFTQIAMLAQGEFMKLLHASSKERKEIFARIFDTKIYAYIEREINNRAKEKNIQLIENRKDIQRELSRIRCIDESVYAQEWNAGQYQDKFRESDKEEFLELVNNICRESVKAQKELKKQKQINEEKRSQIEEQISVADSVNKLFTDLENWRRDKEKLDIKADETDAIRQQVSRAGKAMIVDKFHSDFVIKTNEKSASIQRMTELEKWLNENESKMKLLQKNAEEAIDQYENEAPKLHSEIAKITDSLEKYEKIEGVRERLANTIKQLDEKNTEMQQFIKNAQTYQSQKEQLKVEIENLKNAAYNVETLSREIEILEIRQNEIQKLLDNIMNLESFNKSLIICQEKYNKALQSESEKNREYDALHQEFIKNQAAMLRAGLKEGEACPVCGSIQHEIHLVEKATESNIKDISGEKLQTAKDELQETGKNREKTYTQLQNTITKKQGCEDSIVESITKIFDKEIFVNEFRKAAFKNDAAVIENIKLKITEVQNNTQENLDKKKIDKENSLKNNEKISQKEKQLQAIEAQINDNEADIKRTDKDINELNVEKSTLCAQEKGLQSQLVYKNMDVAQKAITDKQTELSVIENKKNTAVESRDSAKETQNTKFGEYTKEKEILKRAEEHLREAEDLYKEKLENQGFADTEDFEKSFLEQDKIEELQNKINEYILAVEKVNDNIERLERETSGRKKIDTSAYKAEKESINQEKAVLEQKDNVLYNIVTVNQESYNKASALYKAREELRRSAAVLNNLDQTANGNIARKHINFQTYIQRRYFKQIINSANKRLYEMSNHQFILQCRELNELGTQGEVGLDLDVYSMVNEQSRDVKTLSGGESFMAALSMALGMADIIQNNAGKIHIDTMFIDEGFGSLSEETRNQAVNILNELSKGDRLVGIISHVSELKAQVETKLEVTKTDKGSKAAWNYE